MQKVIIYTDGSSRGNPGPGGWGSIVIFSKGKNDENNELGIKNQEVTELGGGEKHTTNNRMELMAVIRSLEFVSKLSTNPSTKLRINNLKLTTVINTDSSYVLNSATKWVYGWQKNNWKTKLKDDVLNKDLWEEFLEVSMGLKLEWNLLKGHSGIPTNERCDVIATTFADGEKPKLYKGSLSEYGIDISVSSVSKPKSHKLSAKSSSKKGTPFSYVSEIGGVVKTHKTWTECEARTKGKSKARFKKVFSSDEEKALIASWRKIS